MFRLILPLCAAALALTACGSTSLDLDKAEALIADAVVEQVGADVDSVTCPEDVEADPGGTFECEVTAADGTRGQALVTQKDDEGNVSISAPFVHTANLEDRIADDLRRQVGGQVELECPMIVVGEKDATFECEASGDGDTATVLVTQKDDQGNVRYEIQQ